jgi:outer membrane protein OmpA-like peptidoglycan-associated protein
LGSTSKQDKNIDINKILKDISFEYDSQKLTEKSTKSIDTICSYIRNNNIKSVNIKAKGDGDKENEYEIALEESRSLYLKKILAERCFKTFQISTVSYGEEKPFNRTGEVDPIITFN